MLLFEPLRIKSLLLPNRWVMSPMCMYSCDDGLANDFHFVHYGSRAQGGAGLIIVEATGVVPEGRITPHCMGLWNDNQATALAKIVDFIHSHTPSKVGIQLNHSGRKGSAWQGKTLTTEEGGWQRMSPSPLPYDPVDEAPSPLSTDEIKKIIKAFASASLRAVEAGFDLIEIHAAHGYLLHQFLSPLSNQREDEYGGSFENRIRFLLEVVQAIRTVIPEDMPLFVRISATEYATNDDKGWNLDDSIELSKILKETGVDFIDVSSGGNLYDAHQSANNSFQTPFADEIKTKTGIMTGALGMITSAEEAEDILQNGHADLVFMGRELLRNPYLPAQTAIKVKEACFFPSQYERAIPQT